MAEGSDPAAAAGNQQAPAQTFNIQKIYLKDCSFEAPQSPEVFRNEWKPQVSIDLGTETRQLAENTYEALLKITVTTRVGEEVAYLCEVQQAGVITLQGFDDNTRGALLGSYCPSSLFPFAREAIADLVGKGGFPALLLQPVNFDALYLQKQRQQASTAAAAEGNGAA